MNRQQGRTLAVVGASGFIGTRVVEHLILATDCRVHAAVRSFSRLSRLSELPQERLSFHRANLLDADALAAAFEGCDVVVDCAFGCDGPPERQWMTTVDGARNVVRAARQAGVRRLVHVGTAAVHDVDGRATFDEDSPRCAATRPSYENAKQVAEDIVLGGGLSAVVVRPTVVYGPWGRDWTTTVLTRLAAGVPLPSGHDGGISNAVYVDDVGAAILAACGSAAEGSILVGSDETVTWGRFYDAFRAVAPVADANGAPLEDWEKMLYAQRARANLDKARRLLGYRPRVSFDDGMAMVAAWHRWQGQGGGSA